MAVCPSYEGNPSSSTTLKNVAAEYAIVSDRQGLTC